MKTLPGRGALIALTLVLSMFAGATGSLLGVCGPFTDFTDAQFCPFVLQIFYLGVTTGTTPTTFDPAANTSRLQMAAFLSRTVDRVLKRGSSKAAVGKFWTPQNETVLALTNLANGAQWAKSDGADVWATSFNSATIARVRASDGKLLDTWTGATSVSQPLVAMGKVLAPAFINTTGSLYMIDPSLPAGAVTTVASNLGDRPIGITFDGSRIWTANFGNNASGGGVSIVTPGATIPWASTNITAGFAGLSGAVFDGSNVWVTDTGAEKLLKLDSTGAILTTVTVPTDPRMPVFDGTNIWVPTSSSAVAVVRASNGALLATLTGNGLGNSFQAAFDGERVLITDLSENQVSLFKAVDLSPLGFFPTGSGTAPKGVCSDGLNFWIVFSNTNRLARF
jgi:hypothetical protein